MVLSYLRGREEDHLLLALYATAAPGWHEAWSLLRQGVLSCCQTQRLWAPPSVC